MTCLAERSGPVGVGIDGAVSFVSRDAGFAEVLADHDVGRQLAQASGTSASFISNTTEPSALLMRLDLLVHLMVEKTSVPAWVNRLVIRMVLIPSVAGRPSHPTRCRSHTHVGACPLKTR